MCLQNLLHKILNFLAITLALMTFVCVPVTCEVTGTANCQRLQQIKLNIDESVDPCENFYGYACNNWKLQHSSAHYDSVAEMLSHQMNLKLISVMDSVDQKTLPLRILNESVNYYKSCLNARGTNILLGFLEILKPSGGMEWPLLQELQLYRKGDLNISLDNWPAEKFDYMALLGHLRNYGFSEAIINLEFYNYALDIVTPRLFRPKSQHRIASISKLLQQLGFPIDKALEHAERLNATMNYWENLLQDISTSYLLSYSEIKERFPYLKNFLENIDIYDYDDNERFELYNIEYFKILLRQRLNASEKRNLCDYIMIKFLLYLQQKIDPGFSKLTCIKEVRQQLDLPTSILYYGYIYQPEELKSNADIQMLFQKMRSYLLQNYEQHLKNKEKDFLEITELLNDIKLNVGNMPRNMSPYYLDKLVEDLPILSANNFYKNYLYLLKHGSFLELRKYHKTHDLSLNRINDNDVRPYYDRHSKMLILQFVTLQPPIYHHSYDPIFKLSILGCYLAAALHTSLPYYMLRSVLHTSDFEIAYQAYIEEQKTELQPGFTDIPWKKLFLLSYTQSFCIRNASEYRWTRSWLAMYNEAFQCNATSSEERK